jgi:hypothetical protein
MHDALHVQNFVTLQALDFSHGKIIRNVQWLFGFGS